MRISPLPPPLSIIRSFTEITEWSVACELSRLKFFKAILNLTL